MKKQPIITLLTDFKPKDGYSGMMKGVILSINPQCRIIDLAHEITSQHVMEAAFVLGYSYRYFPKGSIHVVVIDPGVGGERRPIAVETRDYTFVGPDNGVFSLILQEAEAIRVFELSCREYFLPEVSNTFHGRDIFSPVAAHLSRGILLKDMGDEIKNFVRINLPRPRLSGGEIEGEILYIDGFGNLITNIDQQLITDFAGGEPFTVEIGKIRINRVLASYCEAGKGELLAIFGSSGFLEISVNQGNAGMELTAKTGGRMRITVQPH